MLKARFRLLLGRIQSHSLEFIVNAFRSACCLHNMILDHDGNMTAPAVVATYEAMSDQRDYIDTLNILYFVSYEVYMK